MNSILPPPLSDIKELYLERPSRYAHWSLGRWFAEAHGLSYTIRFFNLRNAQNPDACLREIKLLGIEALPLEALKAWNIEHGKDPF